VPTFQPNAACPKAKATYCLKAGDAKRLGGKYALCVWVGRHLIPISDPLDTFALAVARWGSRRELSAVIGCCNRLARRWEFLKYNPLTAHGHPKRP
jgi:hypothetical protein